MFIELTLTNNSQILLNINEIMFIETNVHGGLALSTIITRSEFRRIEVIETYSEIIHFIKQSNVSVV